MKSGKRVIAVDESRKRQDGSWVIVLVEFRGNELLERVKLDVFDGDEDPTEFLASRINAWVDKKHISAVIVDGICLGELNLVDIFELSNRISNPVISVTKNEPNKEEFRNALRNAGADTSIFEKYGDPKCINPKTGKIYTHYAGTSEHKTSEIIDKTVLKSSVPEALRVADKIASGVPEKWEY